MKQIVTVLFVVVVAGGSVITHSGQGRSEKGIRTRDALARSESWMDHRTDLISARPPGIQSVETVGVKIVDYQSPLGTFPLAVVPVNDTGYTYLMDARRLSIEGRETFYIKQDDDLVMCAVGPGFVYLVPSFGKTQTLPGGLPSAIARLVETVDDAHLAKVESRELIVNLRDNVPGSDGMWSRGAHAANPTILAKTVVDSVLRLDLESLSGAMRRSVWIDLKEGKLLKYSPNGKGHY